MASLRRYATIDEVQEFADVTSTNDTEFEDRISQCEEIIDSYVGFQEKFMRIIVSGMATDASTSTLVDDSSDTVLDLDDNYYDYCVVEIIGGTGVGQQRKITGSSKSARSITIAPNWTTTPDATSVYKIYQLGKFPRHKDVYHDGNNAKYYKSIPEQVKRATAAQLAYMIEQGDNFFAGEDSEVNSESILNYSYTKGGGQDGQTSRVRLISPRARSFLRGIMNRTGRMIV